MLGVHLGCPISMLLYVSPAIKYFDADTRIIGVEIKDHKMKILNFPGDITIFLLRDINRHTRMQAILKSHEKASS